MLELPPLPPIWVPSKPAIIRTAPDIILPGDDRFDLSMMPGIAPCIAGGATIVPFDASFVAGSYVARASGGTSFTQSVDIGDADPTKISVISIGGAANTTISAASIDGVSATIIQTAGNNAFSAILYAAVSSGGNVNVTLTIGAASALGFGAYRIVGTGLSLTPSSTANPAGGGDSTRTATLTNTVGGVSIITGRGNNANTISNVVMNINDIFVGSDARLKSGIHYPTSSGSLGYALSASRSIVGAHWAAPII